MSLRPTTRGLRAGADSCSRRTPDASAGASVNAFVCGPAVTSGAGYAPVQRMNGRLRRRYERPGRIGQKRGGPSAGACNGESVVPRLRIVVLTAGVGCACVTLAITLSPQLHFAYRNDALHVALETTATLTGLVAAYLFMGRFRRRGRIDELMLSSGLAMLALSNLVFAALPATFGLGSNQVIAWGALIANGIAALIIAAASLLPRHRLGGAPRRVAWLGSGITVGLVTVIGVLVAVFKDGLPPAVRLPAVRLETARPILVGHTVVLVVQGVIAVAYAVAAFGFLRRSERDGDDLSGWLAVGCVLASAARYNYLLYPSMYSRWVYTGDFFRLAFYLVLLAGAAREVSSYWASSVEAAHLEERRRIARDLHDGLAQEVACVARNAELLRGGDVNAELVERILAATERARLQSRSVIAALSARVDEPLDRAVRNAATEAAARYGTLLELRLAAGIVVPPTKREVLVRVTSEAVANAARHSGSPEVRVELERLDGSARLKVVDSGCGFSELEGQDRGFGLVSMRERIEELGGRFHVRSRPGDGTRIEVVL